MTNGLPEFDLESFLPYRFTVVAAQLSAATAKQYRAQYGLSVSEWRVLLNVGYAENPSVRDIERRVSLEKSKVSRAAARLEERGLLVKSVDPADRRLVKLELTSEGVALLKELVPFAVKLQKELEKALDGSGDALQKALDQLTDFMNESPE